MDDLRLDLRQALRSFTKNPTFTAVVVLTLALGIGANTAIFSLLDQVLVRPLPVAKPEQLVLLHGPGAFSGSSSSHANSFTPLSHAMFERLRAGNTVFTNVLAEWSMAVHLTAGGQTTDVRGDLVSGTYFETLGLAPWRGRLFTAEDDRVPGGHPVVVLGHGFWTRRFAADPGLVGQTVRVNDHAMTVVGVAPPGFHGITVGESVDLYVPLAMQAQVLPTWPKALGDWRIRFLTVVARLKEGVPLPQAHAAINVLYGQLLREDLATVKTASDRFRIAFLQKQLELQPAGRGTAGLREEARTPLLVLMGMVGLVLLIACANVANLLMARASSRQKEIAIRLALGAGRRRLVRQLLVESLVFSVAGGALGIAFAAWTGALILKALPSDQAVLVLSADPDLRVTVFAFALAVVTGVVFGLAPALQSTRPQLAPTLKNEAGSVAGGTAPFRFRKGLVVAQVALSLLLLIGAGLFTRSLSNLSALDPGFEPERLLAFSVDPALGGYELARRFGLFARLQDDLAAEPGVVSVSLAQAPLMTNSNTSSTVRVEGYEAREDEDMNPNFNSVGPGFFATMGIPLLAGRDFAASDVKDAPKVAVVNEGFAKYFYGSQSPIGRRFGMGRREGFPITIVGVVRDSKAASLREKPLRFAYVPYTQDERVGHMTYYVRSGVDPVALGTRIRAVVRQADAGLPVTDMKSMRAQIRESLFVDRMVASLSAAFGLLATLLAAVGLYGVMSYAVSLRTREIGIRVALGAERRTVLAMVLREVAVLALVGVVIGLPSGYGLGRLIESQLFGLSAYDPLTFGLATAALLASAMLAGYIPAARATRVDPLVALRYESGRAAAGRARSGRARGAAGGAPPRRPPDRCPGRGDGPTSCRGCARRRRVRPGSARARARTAAPPRSPPRTAARLRSSSQAPPPPPRWPIMASRPPPRPQMTDSTIPVPPPPDASAVVNRAVASSFPRHADGPPPPEN
ncbi:MAG TPA: ABC transporter permease [Vicinamibacteria bacterium]|nr:ABC transporter permease [Vicinamibacteria bacterium]